MKEILDTILKRRSVRQYDPKPIPKNILQEIINAGNAAPTGNNAQGWRFVVVENGAFMDTLRGLAMSRYDKWMEHAPQSLVEKRREIDARVNDPIYYDAPVVVFVIGSGMTADLDTPMVCENMMLAARAHGIGSCWVYFGQLPLDDENVRATLKMQEGEKVFGPILLGYPAGDFPDSPPKHDAAVTWI